MRPAPPPICSVAWPKPEKIGSGGVTTTGAATTGAAAASSMACPNPENPWAGAGATTTGLYPLRKCAGRAVDCWNKERKNEERKQIVCRCNRSLNQSFRWKGFPKYKLDLRGRK